MECSQCGPIRHRKSSYCPFCGRGLQVASVRSVSGNALVSSWPVAPLSNEDDDLPQPEEGLTPLTGPVRETDSIGALRLETAPRVFRVEAATASDRPVASEPNPPVRLPGPVERPQILPAWVVVLMVVLLLAVAAGYIFTG